MLMMVLSEVSLCSVVRFSLIYLSLIASKLLFLGLDIPNSLPSFMLKTNVFFAFSIMVTSEVTDECMWHIGRYCKKLEALDITDLDKLTDKSLEFITEGCRYLKSLKLTSNRFRFVQVSQFVLFVHNIR